MASEEHVQRLMRAIGPQLDLLEVTEFEGLGTWTLVLDEDTVLFAQLDEPGRRIVLSADVARPAEEGRLRVYELLLRYNNRWPETGGVRMALEEAAGTVVQLFDVPIADLDLSRLQGIVAGFADTLNAWREIVGRARAEPAGEPFDPMLGGMIRG
jgi:Tir chaperone protein (CesT) family